MVGIPDEVYLRILPSSHAVGQGKYDLLVRSSDNSDANVPGSISASVSLAGPGQQFPSPDDSLANLAMLRVNLNRHGASESDGATKTCSESANAPPPPRNTDSASESSSARIKLERPLGTGDRHGPGTLPASGTQRPRRCFSSTHLKFPWAELSRSCGDHCMTR
jgi:hypothetical protein